MTEGRLQFLAIVVVAVVGLTVAPIGAAAPTADGAATANAQSVDEGNDSMGMAMSAFMQGSSADAEERVESGMFVASYERADSDHRAELVSQRTRALETRLAELEAERDRLETELDERDEPAPLLEARVARLTVRMNGFEDAVNETEPRAAATGVGASRLDSLRSSAQAFHGERIAAVASEFAGLGPRRGPYTGPPDWAGGPSAGPGDATNAGPDAGENETTDAGPGNGAPGNGPGEAPADSQRGGPGAETPATDADVTDDAPDGTDDSPDGTDAD